MKSYLQEEGLPQDGRRSNRNLLLAGAGVALAAAALYVRNRTQQAERDYPPMGQFIEVDGVRLHYIERGQGQPLVFLHGNGALIEDFITSGLLDLAAQKYRVIVFDRPGHGHSDRPRTTIWTPQAQARLLHGAFDQLGIRTPIVAGHSWGTLVALSLALDFPDDVKSLVLMSGYYYPTARLDVPLLSGPAIPGIGDVMRFTVSPLVSRMLWPAMLKRIFSPAPIPQRFADEYPVWMTLRPSQIRAAAADNAMLIPGAYSLRDRYHELMMPVVIMTGDSDRLVDYRVHSERLHRELPQSSLHVTSGVGHMLHHFAQDEIMLAIDHAATAVGVLESMHGVGGAKASDDIKGVPGLENKHIFPAPTQIN